MIGITQSLIVGSLLIGSQLAFAGIGAQKCALKPNETISQVENGQRLELTCVGGTPTQFVHFFKDSHQASQELIYKAGKAYELKIYNTAGEWTYSSRFTHLPTGNIIKESMQMQNGQVSSRTKEELHLFDPEILDLQPHSLVVKRWTFKNSDPSQIDFVAVYSLKDQKKIMAKEYYDQDGNFESRIVFKYKDGEENPVRFMEYNAKGDLLTTYSTYEPFEPQKRLRKAGLDAAEIQRRLKHQKNPNRFLMGVIDGGFDYNHPELSWKWWSNPTDPVDGLDNDGNGWIDDQFGWEREKNTYLPTESSTNMTLFSRPDSHGTHVSHIATRGLENVALIGFAGNYTNAQYVDQIASFIKKHKVKVINISIGLPLDNKDDLGLKNGIKAFERMIRTTPETLFVVASGNEGRDLDIYSNRQYPANFSTPNVLTVGSVETDHLDPSRLRSYKMSSWSNYGAQTVDILAPGFKISAARLGGGEVIHSGTSMAAPYMAREAARLWMQFPSLNALQVREIFIQSAAKLDERPQVLSGGVVDFEAAVKLARQMTAKP